VDDVPGPAEVIGERRDARGEPQDVMEQNDRCHISPTATGNTNERSMQHIRGSSMTKRGAGVSYKLPT
jgi:hypothetical protein